MGAHQSGSSAWLPYFTSNLHLVPRPKNTWSYTSIPPIHLYGVVLKLSTGTTLPLPLPLQGSLCPCFWLSCLYSKMPGGVQVLSHKEITSLLHHLTGSYLCNQKIFSVNSLITSFQPAKQLFEQNASNWWMSHSVFLNARLLGFFEGFFFFFFFLMKHWGEY